MEANYATRLTTISFCQPERKFGWRCDQARNVPDAVTRGKWRQPWIVLKSWRFLYFSIQYYSKATYFILLWQRLPRIINWLTIDTSFSIPIYNVV